MIVKLNLWVIGSECKHDEVAKGFCPNEGSFFFLVVCVLDARLVYFGLNNKKIRNF